MDTTSEIRLQAVNPTLAAKVRLVDAEFQRETGDDHLEVVQGLRNYAEQLRLWSIGRKQQDDGTWVVVNESLVVTQAPPGYSWHEFGLADDPVPRSLLPIKGWCPESPLWATMARIAQSYGLVVGACWHHKDLPHVQLTGRFPVSPDDEVRQLFQQGGLQAVWDAAQIET